MMEDDLKRKERLLHEQSELLRKAWYKMRDYLEKDPNNETLKKQVKELKEKYMDLANKRFSIEQTLRQREERKRLEEAKKRKQDTDLQVYLDGDVAYVSGAYGQVAQKGLTIKPKVIQGKKISLKKNKSQAEVKRKKIDERHYSRITYIGGEHFKPNDLNSEYAIFKKDGFLHVVGNFTSDWLKDHYSQVVGDIVNNKDSMKIKLWNRLEKGDTPLDGFDVKVKVNNDGSIKVIGNVDNLEYHNQILDNDLGERKEGKHFKTGDNKNNSNDVREKRDVSDLNNSAEKKEAVKGRKITRKNAKPSLIKRGIEKFKGLKKWQKVAIVAGVIAVVGVGAFVLGPQIINGINQLINPENVDVANKVIQASPAVPDTVSQAAQSIDYSSIGEGHTVFSNAADAANNVNGVISNQWFSNNPIDVFNTATNSYMGLTPDQLNDPNLLAELAKDPNNTMLFGNSMSDPSGFIGLDDVVNTVTKMR